MLIEKTSNLITVIPRINSNISGGMLIPTNPNINNVAQSFSYHRPIASIAVTKAYTPATIPLNFKLFESIVKSLFANHLTIENLVVSR